MSDELLAENERLRAEVRRLRNALEAQSASPTATWLLVLSAMFLVVGLLWMCRPM